MKTAQHPMSQRELDQFKASCQGRTMADLDKILALREQAREHKKAQQAAKEALIAKCLIGLTIGVGAFTIGFVTVGIAHLNGLI